ncbi:MAG: alpha/beta hydrolase [Rhodobacteraceae bacterium]|nr:alpha/beta hydrolase [Paracoccaceae bacterium]
MSGRAEEWVFAGADLRARLFNPPSGRGSDLLVTFRPRLDGAAGFDRPEPVRRFLRRDWSHLYLQSRVNDWYLNAETEAFADRLRSLTEGFAYRVAIGFSMGGYAALRFSRALRLDHLVAVSPQVSLAASVAPFENRYPEAADFDRELGDLARHGWHDLAGTVLYDPFRRLDRLHAEAIGLLFPRLDFARMVFGGHPATTVLRETVGFGAVQDLILERRAGRSEILALHRRHREHAPSYWSECAAACARHGRPEVERAALACQAALAAG